MPKPRHPLAALRALDQDYVRETNEEVLTENYAIARWIDSGAPSPMSMWLQSQGMPVPADDRPLTVAQAAAREGVHPKTIRRRLPGLAAMEPAGAYKVGRVWRIVPVGLDALREGSPTKTTTPTRVKRKPKASKRPTSTRWED